MTPERAREVLFAYRPGVDSATDPDVALALETLKHNPELQKWFEDHSATQSSIRAKFREIGVPPGLANRIILQKPKTPSRWNARIVWAAAAAVILFIGIALAIQGQRPSYSFAAFRQKMVRTAMGNYDMPLMTNDLGAIREYVKARNGHGDYELTPGLARLPGTGAVVFPWHSRTVSLVCLNGGKGKDVFLFVVNRKDLADSPSSQQVETIGKLATASWAQQDKIYVLATKGDEVFLRSLLN